MSKIPMHSPAEIKSSIVALLSIVRQSGRIYPPDRNVIEIPPLEGTGEPRS